MKRLLFIYPRKGGRNPYISNLTNSLISHFNLLEYAKGEDSWPPCLSFLRASFKADCVILNWIESVAFGKFSIIQTFIVLVALVICKIRNNKVIWIFHNIHPHQGVNIMSNRIMDYLFLYSDLIITHSDLARQVAIKRAKCPVRFFHHPIKSIVFHPIEIDTEFDLFYWGDIYEYKGIARLAEILKETNSTIKLHILGKCTNNALRERLLASTTQYVTFDDQFADYDTIAGYIKCSKYVIFPYIGNSISSSGALIDTLVLGGTILGPQIGAFKDLEECGLCFTYNTIEDIKYLISNPKTISHEVLNDFINENSWGHFGYKLFEAISSI